MTPTFIVVFIVSLVAVAYLLSLFPRSSVARIAFSWFGPVPQEGETLARYQLRWSGYALNWLAQIAFVFALLSAAAYFYPGIKQHPLFLIFVALALPIGGGMALLAAATFLLKAAKARYIGPNPIYDGDSNRRVA